MLEPEPLLVVEVGPGKHRADVAVEVGHRAGEGGELEEHGGHGFGHPRWIGGGELIRRHGGQGRELVGHGGEELARHLTRSAGRRQHRFDLAVYAHAQAGSGIAGGLALILGDRRDPDLARAGQQVTVLLQEAEPLVDHRRRQIDAPLHEIVCRPFGQQRSSEQAHDLDVATRFRRRGVGIKAQPFDFDRLAFNRLGRHRRQLCRGSETLTSV